MIESKKNVHLFLKHHGPSDQTLLKKLWHVLRGAKSI